MDDRMRKAFDAWFRDRYAAKDRPTPSECAEWTINYLRRQQEPIADVIEVTEPVEGNWGHLRRVLRARWVSDRVQVGDNLYTRPVPSVPVPEGWKEAAIAWEVCASIHRQYAKGKDDLFSTRQKDFMDSAENARTSYRSAPSPTEKDG